MNNLYCIGMRGTGKTTIGTLVAKKLHRSFVDIDEVIEKQEKVSIPELIRQKGWKYFRKKESHVVSDIAKKKNLVASAGGGVLTSPQNGKKLKKSGNLILLTAPVEILQQRLQSSGQPRPSLTGKPFLNELEEVWEKRKKVYFRFADVVFDTTQNSPEEIVDAIVLWTKKI